ncbi:MAG TPA: hypothetical protein VGK29_17665 [Paludibaculum sp.]|jgi:hypothetical protein
MTNQRPAKGYFTEAEAAKALNLSLPQFRILVRRHIIVTDDEMANLPMTSFQPSDLVVLRMLADGIPIEATAAAG